MIVERVWFGALFKILFFVHEAKQSSVLLAHILHCKAKKERAEERFWRTRVCGMFSFGKLIHRETANPHCAKEGSFQIYEGE